MAAWSSGPVGNVGWSPLGGNDLLETGSNQGGLLTVVNEPYNSCSLRHGRLLTRVTHRPTWTKRRLEPSVSG
jgi:hypothetical protein